MCFCIEYAIKWEMFTFWSVSTLPHKKPSPLSDGLSVPIINGIMPLICHAHFYMCGDYFNRYMSRCIKLRWHFILTIITVFDLISEHTLISEHLPHPPPLPPPPPAPPFCAGEDYCQSTVLEIYVYWLCYCVASCNRYLMLINHPTDGATRGLTLRVSLLGRKKKK